jgi:hypothetical protein
MTVFSTWVQSDPGQGYVRNASHPTVTTQTGTSYTFALTDANTLVRFTNGSAVAATIPPNSSVAFDTGTVLNIEQASTGAVTFTAGSGVTLEFPAALTAATLDQYAVAAAIKRDTDTWLLFGRLGG